MEAVGRVRQARWVSGVSDPLLAGLNSSQRAAVLHADGPLLLLAGAGSGKTRVITTRIAYLVSRCGVGAEHVLAVTFTNKAADEMRQRVDSLIESGPSAESGPFVSTFHSLCAWLLRRHIGDLGQGYGSGFSIYDDADSIKVIRSCVKELNLGTTLEPKSALAEISAAKNRGYNAELFAEAAESADSDFLRMVSAVFATYDWRLRQENALDFDDLLLKAVVLLRQASIRNYYARRFRYVMVDEFQDTNPVQFALLRLLGQDHRNVCVVGDEGQSIYGFRGSDISLILNFEREYPGTRTIRLEQNYRSSKTIVGAANAVLVKNTARFDKRLHTENPAGEPVYIHRASDQDAEAAYVADQIARRLAVSPRDRVAVLYRTNLQSRVLEEALRRRRVAYQVVGGLSFYEREEIKDVLAYLRLAANPRDGVAMMRVINTPARGLGKKAVEQLVAAACEGGRSLWETICDTVRGNAGAPRLASRAADGLARFKVLVERVRGLAEAGDLSGAIGAACNDSGYSAELRKQDEEEAGIRLGNVNELIRFAAEYDGHAEALREFLDHAALISEQDGYDEDVSVALMTVHAAKGLEFPVVFVVGLEEGLFPHSRSMGSLADLEEERRLYYVAITRAEKVLYLSFAEVRRIFGESLMTSPSRFLDEIPSQLIGDAARAGDTQRR